MNAFMCVKVNIYTHVHTTHWEIRRRHDKTDQMLTCNLINIWFFSCQLFPCNICNWSKDCNRPEKSSWNWYKKNNFRWKKYKSFSLWLRDGCVFFPLKWTSPSRRTTLSYAGNLVWTGWAERSSLLFRRFLFELRRPRNLQKSARSPPAVFGSVYCTLASCSALCEIEATFNCISVFYCAFPWSQRKAYNPIGSLYFN